MTGDMRGAASVTMKALCRGWGGSATVKALSARSNERKMERAQQHGQQQVLLVLLAFTAERFLGHMLRGGEWSTHQHELDSTLKMYSPGRVCSKRKCLFWCFSAQFV